MNTCLNLTVTTLSLICLTTDVHEVSYLEYQTIGLVQASLMNGFDNHIIYQLFVVNMCYISTRYNSDNDHIQWPSSNLILWI